MSRREEVIAEAIAILQSGGYEGKSLEEVRANLEGTIAARRVNLLKLWRQIAWVPADGICVIVLIASMTRSVIAADWPLAIAFLSISTRLSYLAMKFHLRESEPS